MLSGLWAKPTLQYALQFGVEVTPKSKAVHITYHQRRSVHGGPELTTLGLPGRAASGLWQGLQTLR